MEQLPTESTSDANSFSKRILIDSVFDANVDLEPPLYSPDFVPRSLLALAAENDSRPFPPSVVDKYQEAQDDIKDGDSTDEEELEQRIVAESLAKRKLKGKQRVYEVEGLREELDPKVTPAEFNERVDSAHAMDQNLHVHNIPGLLKLPNEILGLILCAIPKDTIIELSRTCKYLDMRLTPILYRFIKFSNTMNWALFNNCLVRKDSLHSYGQYVEVIRFNNRLVPSPARSLQVLPYNPSRQNFWNSHGSLALHDSLVDPDGCTSCIMSIPRTMSKPLVALNGGAATETMTNSSTRGGNDLNSAIQPVLSTSSPSNQFVFGDTNVRKKPAAIFFNNWDDRNLISRPHSFDHLVVGSAATETAFFSRCMCRNRHGSVLIPDGFYSYVLNGGHADRLDRNDAFGLFHDFERHMHHRMDESMPYSLHGSTLGYTGTSPSSSLSTNSGTFGRASGISQTSTIGRSLSHLSQRPPRPSPLRNNLLLNDTADSFSMFFLAFLSEQDTPSTMRRSFPRLQQLLALNLRNLRTSDAFSLHEIRLIHDDLVFAVTGVAQAADWYVRRRPVVAPADLNSLNGNYLEVENMIVEGRLPDLRFPDDTVVSSINFEPELLQVLSAIRRLEGELRCSLLQLALRMPVMASGPTVRMGGGGVGQDMMQLQHLNSHPDLVDAMGLVDLLYERLSDIAFRRHTLRRLQRVTSTGSGTDPSSYSSLAAPSSAPVVQEEEISEPSDEDDVLGDDMDLLLFGADLTMLGEGDMVYIPLEERFPMSSSSSSNATWASSSSSSSTTVASSPSSSSSTLTAVPAPISNSSQALPSAESALLIDGSRGSSQTSARLSLGHGSTPVAAREVVNPVISTASSTTSNMAYLQASSPTNASRISLPPPPPPRVSRHQHHRAHHFHYNHHTHSNPSFRPLVIRAFTLRQVSEHCPNLTILDLSYSHVEADHYLPDVQEYACNLLHHGHLSDIDFIRVPVTALDVMREVVERCLYLESLDLRGCDWVTDEMVLEVVEASWRAGGRLRALNLMQCGRVNSRGARLYFVKDARELRGLVRAVMLA
ncbi:hypothetical protein HDV05_005739 [Chytridiales sp. JEL 0842]|nr:hypothetical protein HDV05_005739 [Chytridiales sp. JEL 0842]